MVPVYTHAVTTGQVAWTTVLLARHLRPMLPLPCPSSAMVHPTPQKGPPMSALPATALVPYLGPGDDGALAWLRLAPAERRRTAMQAAHDHDAATLWSLTEA